LERHADFGTTRDFDRDGVVLLSLSACDLVLQTVMWNVVDTVAFFPHTSFEPREDASVAWKFLSNELACGRLSFAL
jgi:hypothetical protein